MISASQLLAVFSTVATILPTHTLLVDAQALGPSPWKIPVYLSAFASSGTHLFIQGGTTGSGSRSNEYFQLDLSVNWTVDNPAWADLRPATVQLPIQGITAALLPNNRGMVVKSYEKSHTDFRPFAGILSSQGIWTRFEYSLQSIIYSEYAIAASPSGEVYFIKDGKVYSPENNTEYPIDPLEKVVAATWCPSLGGAKGTVLATQITEFNADFRWLNGRTWQKLDIAQGSIPRIRGHCLVKDATEDKYYVFGGSSFTNSSALSGQLYMLDMESRIISKLGPETDKRTYMACAASKHSFFVWGGKNTEGDVVTSPAPLVFHFASGAWVNSNIIPPPPQPPQPPQPPPPPPPPPVVPKTPDNPGNGIGTNPGAGNGNGSSQLNVSAIAGGVGGGIAFIALVALFFYVRRIRSESSKYDGMYSSKRSSPRDDYSMKDRQGSRSSGSERESSARHLEPLSTMHGEIEPASNPLEKKSPSSPFRREPVQEYRSREQSESLRYIPSSDHDMDSPRARGHMDNTRYNSLGSPLDMTNTSATNSHDPAVGWNQRWDRWIPQPQYSPVNDTSVGKALYLGSDSQSENSSPRPPITQMYPGHQQIYPSPHLYDQQLNSQESRTRQGDSLPFLDFHKTDLTRPNHPQHSPQYGALPNSNPQYGALPNSNPQYGGSHPLSLHHGSPQPRDLQYGPVRKSNPPHSTPALSPTRDTYSPPRDVRSRSTQNRDSPRRAPQSFTP